jgi:hypothetical protein
MSMDAYVLHERAVKARIAVDVLYRTLSTTSDAYRPAAVRVLQHRDWMHQKALQSKSSCRGRSTKQSSVVR